jgi:hypothetical protein
MLFRCNHPDCPTTEFEGTAPVCPDCKTDARDPQWRGQVVRLVTIHFVPRAAHPTGKTLDHVRAKVRACDGKPAVASADGMHAITGEAAVVNCQACRATDAWKAEAPGQDDGLVPAHLDFPVEVREGRIEATGAPSAQPPSAQPPAAQPPTATSVPPNEPTAPANIPSPSPTE